MTGRRIKEPAQGPDTVTKKEIQSAVKVVTRRIKEPAQGPDTVTKKEIQSAVKVVTQQRLYHDLELEIKSLKSYVEGCHK